MLPPAPRLAPAKNAPAWEVDAELGQCGNPGVLRPHLVVPYTGQEPGPTAHPAGHPPIPREIRLGSPSFYVGPFAPGRTDAGRARRLRQAGHLGGGRGGRAFTRRPPPTNAPLVLP
jgi:hypothetical protein